jgi:hypothetical protein
VLLDRQRVVRAALHGRVVGDDHALASLDDADPGHDPRRRRVAVVQLPRGERIELEEGGAGIAQKVDAFAHGQLAARAMPFECVVTASAGDERGALAQLRDEVFHPLPPCVERPVARDLRGEHPHRREPIEPRCQTLLNSCPTWTQPGKGPGRRS